MDSDGIDWDRLDRYVCGVGSLADQATLAAWVDSDPNLQRLADAMRTVGRSRQRPRKVPDAQAALVHVQRRLGMRHRA